VCQTWQAMIETGFFKVGDNIVTTANLLLAKYLDRQTWFITSICHKSDKFLLIEIRLLRGYKLQTQTIEALREKA
jgi:hypothetical protein